jgi:hypothetical protein
VEMGGQARETVDKRRWSLSYEIGDGDGVKVLGKVGIGGEQRRGAEAGEFVMAAAGGQAESMYPLFSPDGWHLVWEGSSSSTRSETRLG